MKYLKKLIIITLVHYHILCRDGLTNLLKVNHHKIVLFLYLCVRNKKCVTYIYM